MNLSPESVKKTLLNKVNELSASSWQYTKKTTDFTRNRKISFSDVLLSTISMQKSASKTELLKYFDFNASAPTASALIQQRKKISPEVFDSLFYSFSNAFSLDCSPLTPMCLRLPDLRCYRTRIFIFLTVSLNPIVFLLDKTIQDSPDSDNTNRY